MTPSSRLRFDIEDAPSHADVEVLPNGLEAFNESKWPGHQQWRPLAVFAREGGRIVAGLAGETYSGWLFIRYLWVSEALRGKGKDVIPFDQVPIESARDFACEAADVTWQLRDRLTREIRLTCIRL